jgi:hypothetical protein
VTNDPLYSTWEAGSNFAPPARLAHVMTADESLLWCATVPGSRLLARRILGGAFCLSLAIWLAREAPRGHSMAEYCANSSNSRCETTFLLAWPLAAFCALFAIYLLLLAWKSRVSPWQDLYCVSSVRALRIDGHKPGKVHGTQLDRNQARVDWFGDVRFSRSRTGLSFPGLDDRDARRAVYWANEGRFRSDFLGAAT